MQHIEIYTITLCLCYILMKVMHNLTHTYISLLVLQVIYYDGNEREGEREGQIWIEFVNNDMIIFISYLFYLSIYSIYLSPAEASSVSIHSPTITTSTTAIAIAIAIHSTPVDLLNALVHIVSLGGGDIDCRQRQIHRHHIIKYSLIGIETRKTCHGSSIVTVEVDIVVIVHFIILLYM